MKIIGYYDTAGNYSSYADGYQQEVVIFGDTLRDKFDGIVVGIRDDYGDWVNPQLMKPGIKSKLKLTE